MLARLARLFSRPAAATPVWVEPAELWRWLAGEGAPIVVDVRGPDEFDGPLGHIDGARNVPLAELPASIPELAAEGRPLVLVCLTDQRSSPVARTRFDRSTSSQVPSDVSNPPRLRKTSRLIARLPLRLPPVTGKVPTGCPVAGSING